MKFENQQKNQLLTIHYLLRRMCLSDIELKQKILSITELSQ